MRPRPVRQGLSAVVPIPGEMQVKEALASVCERNITNPPHPHARATFSKNTNLRPALLAQDLNAPLRIPVLAPRPARPYLRLDLQLSWPWRRCGRFSVFVGSFQRSARTLLPVVNFACLPRPQTPKVKKTPLTAFSSPTQTFRLWLCFLETLLVTTRFQRSLVIALTLQCTERAQYCPPATLKNTHACSDACSRLPSSPRTPRFLGRISFGHSGARRAYPVTSPRAQQKCAPAFPTLAPRT